MRCEVEPSEVSSVLKFSPSTYSAHIDDNIQTTYGCISKSGLWLYLVHDTIINIYCAETGKWQGGHSFADSLKNPSARIKAAVEFSSAHISFPCLILAVEQDHESLLCMFDVSLCKVVQAVLVPDKITSLDIVSGNGGVCIETHNLCRRLRYMFGIVAVGTLHGNVFFLDLCLDEDFGCDELLPNITAVYKKNDFSAQKRESAISKNQHVFLHMNEESTSGGSFEFQSRSSILGRYPNGAVSVTAIKYVQSLTALAVGFNFGGIQLWDLHSLMLQFTVRDDQHELAVVSFAFQEPENDPRNFCYLWVIKGHSVTEANLPGAISVASLYSLTYSNRDYRDEFGALYTELQTCNKRFELPLGNGTFHKSSNIGTRLLCCQVVNQKDTGHSLTTALHNESESASEDMSVCFLSWEVWPDADNVPPSYHLAVFDLNQWYQAHMPFSFRHNPNELNSYLGIFSLEEVSRKFNNDVMGLYAVPQSVKKFKSLLVSEEFFYPSSLGFQLMCFSESGQCQATYFGFQRQLLFEIAELGPKVLLNPKTIYSKLIKSGLVRGDLHGGVDRTPLKVQKEAILQLALEYYLPFFFMKCLKEWQYCESIHEGCTSSSILSWAWEKVVQIKQSINQLSVPLFNCSGSDIDKASLKQLYSFRRQLTLIESIFEGYQKYVTPTTEHGTHELRMRKEVINYINMYLRVLLWLRSAQVLPEVCEEEATAKSVVYRLGHLEDSFSVRRSRLKQLHSSLETNDVFLIDGMVAESGIGSSWLEKNGTGLYPPPSIYAALGCYLLDGISLASKHALMLYLLLDLQNMNAENHFRAELKKFPVIFGISKGVVKLVKAFWFLDRKDSENAIKKLLHPAVRLTDIQPWQHQRIVKSFLYWREPQKALKYVQHMEPPQSNIEDMKLHLSVLLACGAITQAYEYQRKKQKLIPVGYGNELLNHLFLGCQETQKLKDLMYLPLNSFESTELIKFLSESEDPKAQESLVIYHLLRCNFFQADKVNEKLSRVLMNKLASIYEATTYERTVDRDALVEGLMASISRPERCLFEEMKQYPSGSLRSNVFEASPQPLSVSVKSSAAKAFTSYEIIDALLKRNFNSPSGRTPGTPSNTKSSSLYQDLPFLGPPVTPECVRQPFNIKSGSSAMTKRSRLSNSPTEISSPAKRSRLLDTTPFVASPLTKRKTSKSMSSDIVTLLQTPPIHRRTSNIRGGGSQSTPTVTPQSILKKKTDTKKKVTTVLHLAVTPPLVSEEESSEEVMNIDEKDPDVETPSRQIRFDLPDSPDSDPTPLTYSKVSEDQTKDSTLSESCNYDLNKSQSYATQDDVRLNLNLTREPLGGRKKEVSIYEDETSPQKGAVMEVEKIAKVPMIVSSIYQHSYPTVRYTPDRGETSSKKSPAKSVDKGPDPKASSSEAVDAASPATSLFGRLLQRSSFLSPLPSKQGSSKTASPVKESETLHADSKETNVANSPATNEKYVPLTPNENQALETMEEEASDDEMFFSPAADNANHEPQQYSFSQPVNLFPESGDSNSTQEAPYDDKQQLDFIEADYQLVENSNEANKDVSYFFSEPSFDGSALPGSVSFKKDVTLHVENMDTSDSKPKPSRETFSFSKPNSVEDDIETECDNEIENTISETTCDDKVIEDIDFEFKTPLPVSKSTKKSRTFLFGKSFTNTKLQERSTNDVEPNVSHNKSISTMEEIDVPSPIIQTEIATKKNSTVCHDLNENDLEPCMDAGKTDKDNVPTYDFTFSEPKSTQIVVERVTLAPSSDISSIFSQSEVKSKPTRRTFVFSKRTMEPSLSETEKEIKSRSEVSPPTAEVASFKSQSEVESRPSNKTFNFSKKITVSETEKEVNVQTSDVSSFSNQSEVARRPSRKTFNFSKKITECGPAETEKEVNIETSNVSSFSFQSEVKSRPSRRTFTFSKRVPLPESKSFQTDETESSEKCSKEKEEFMKMDAETYEEFSGSLKQKSSREGLMQLEGKTLSSPHADSPVESTQLETSSPITTVSTKKPKATKKKQRKEKVSKGVGTTPGLIKSKGKKSQKLEFSFAEPTSPATPEILEALANTPEVPLPSFLFSPPLTRGRLRKKKMDETMEGSFYSVTSEASFARPTTPPAPPVDPILEGIIAEKTLAVPKQKRVSSVQKKTAVRKSKLQSQLNASNLSFISNASLSQSITDSLSKRHSMVLRQTKPKQKPDQLF